MSAARDAVVALLLLAPAAAPAAAQSTLRGSPIRLARSQPIVVDGDLSDDGWRGATRIDTWYETQPGDNTEPKVRNVGYLAYDDRFFYAAFEFDDPAPSAIRAPYSDRDNISGNYSDYGGVILDTRNDGHTAVLLLATPRGVQYDAISDDASNEDAAPDLFWESASKITERGWTLEIRVPFSSLRYHNVDPQTWGIMLYRNYPRDFHYQFFSTKLPRGGNCFICRSNSLVGLEHLPAGGHIVAAPYLAATQTALPSGDLGSPLVNESPRARGGLDVKWTPNADNAVDLTLKPDFSQIESDTAQISANERFALLFPEKRPFFLEGVNLLSTPIQAIYTRTVTAPRWGARATGRAAGIGYTVLVADDAGGGSSVIPGPNDSTFVPQDFGASVFIARAKRDIGRSFVSMVMTDRAAHDGNGHNLVAGPDFQWRPSSTEVVTGQWLASDTRTPNRPDLSDRWTGRSLTSHAGLLQWGHNTTHVDASATYRDIGGDFRADSGFVPQVGYREIFTQMGYTFRPTGFLSRLQTFVNFDRQAEQSGALIFRNLQASADMDTLWSGFVRLRYANDEVRSRARTFPRQQFQYVVRLSPSRLVSQLAADGFVGQNIDFANSRPGRGATVNLFAVLHPGDHLELALIQNQQWLDVDNAAGASRRLFLARVSRIKATYNFTTRIFVRLIEQYAAVHADPSLYVSSMSANSGNFSGSALFAYKLNWQSVVFVGYGDDRELSNQNHLEKTDRQMFVKVSYAFQR